jgi:hypothetical protein
VASDHGEQELGWAWHRQSYQDHAGDAEWLLRDAQRRAIHIRDQGITPEAVMLVAVLNLLQEALGVEQVDIVTFWSGE